jgi:NADH dehydrogenase
MAWNVVIAGGGFGGLYAARRLERVLPRHSAKVTLIAQDNFLLYTPLLPGAGAGTLEPRNVVVPLREMLEHTDVRLARVTGADPALRELRYSGHDGSVETIRYDQLIVALGSVSRVLPVPGLAEHALGFKTLADALAVRNRAMLCLEVAETIEDAEERAAYLTFVFVGAGYAGLEGIAELQDFVVDVLERYPRARITGTRFILVEASERVMPEISAALADFATEELRARGMEVRTGTTLESMDEHSVTLSTGEQIPARTVVWTAGVRPTPVLREFGLPLDALGRLEVDETMQVKGHEGVWGIGDGAAVPDPAKGRTAPCPPTCQHALRQGRQVADNVAAALGHGDPKPFSYKTRGVFVDMGRFQAVAELFGLRVRGFPAWFAARTYHLAMMPGGVRKLRLMLDWTVGLVFGRASAEVGQLGFPVSLGGLLEEQQQTPAKGE